MNTLKTKRVPETLLSDRERVDAFFAPEPNTGCWLWHGMVNARGYGCIAHKERMYRAHRVLYEREVGPIPSGLTLDHLCQNKQCVNPEHLEPVTAAENHRRGFARRTHCKAGHPWVPENIYTAPGRGDRQCKVCMTIRNRARPERRQMRNAA